MTAARDNQEAIQTAGFDVVLGNPPWERVKLQEREFFAQRDPDIATAPNAAARKRAIANLKDANPELLAEFHEAGRRAEGESHLMRHSGRYPFCGRGDINTYAVFAESMRDALSPAGRLGVIVPTGIATDDTTKFFFGDLVESKTLVSYFGFKNERFLFPHPVEHTVTFGLLTVVGCELQSDQMEFCWLAWTAEEMQDPARRIILTADDIALLNPNTRTCPVFRSRRDAEITKAIYRRVPVLIREGGTALRAVSSPGTAPATRSQSPGSPESNPWGLTFMAMFHMANDSDKFVSPLVVCPAIAQSLAEDPDAPPPYLPLYEAKMLHQFDHRWATYARPGADWLDTNINRKPNGDPNARNMTCEERADPAARAAPRYWVAAEEVENKLVKHRRNPETGEMEIVWRWDRQWLLGWRDIARNTDERTVIASVLPRVGVGNKVPLMFSEIVGVHSITCFQANLSAFVFDFASRQKIGGTTLNFFLLRQLPVLAPSAYNSTCPWDASLSLCDWIAPRVLELVYTADDIAGFARDLGYDGPPFRWDGARRARLRAELDAAFFHLYGIDRDDVDYIMDTFPIVKRRDIARTADANGDNGRYITKDTILAIYDEMTEAMAANAAAEFVGRQPTARYETRLDLLPGPPVDADGRFIPLAQWDRANWPSHIHLSHEIAQHDHRLRIKPGRQVAYVLLLLDAWQKAVSKPVLERGLVLMLNDAARRTLLNQPISPSQAASLGSLGDFVRGIDSLYQYIIKSGWVAAVGQTGLRLTTEGTSRLSGASQADRNKAQEVIDVAMRLNDEQFIAAVAKEIDERYEFVSTR